MTAPPQVAATRPVRVTDLQGMKAERRRIVMTTCYDTLFAKLLDECGVDLLLVGDSVAEVLNGAGSTLAATLDQMIYHATAVCRGARRGRRSEAGSGRPVPARGRGVRARLGAGSRAARHENREAARDPGHRHRRWIRMRRAGARVARSPRVDRVLPGEVREALRHTER